MPYKIPHWSHIIDCQRDTCHSTMLRRISIWGRVTDCRKVMAIPTEPRGVFARRMTSSSSSFLIPSPLDHPKSRTAQGCTQEAARAGVKSAAIACVVSAVPTISWANKANLNYTAQALIISGGYSTAVFTLLHAANCIDKLPCFNQNGNLEGRYESSWDKVCNSEVLITRRP